MDDAFYATCEREESLNRHIHGLLDEYVYEHLSTDHQAFMHHVVWQVNHCQSLYARGYKDA
jgi:hypothetical protein